MTESHFFLLEEANEPKQIPRITLMKSPLLARQHPRSVAGPTTPKDIRHHTRRRPGHFQATRRTDRPHAEKTGVVL